MFNVVTKHLKYIIYEIVAEAVKRFFRDLKHKREINKSDPTQETLSLLENLMVKMEKKLQEHRTTMNQKLATIKTFLILNTILLLTIFVLILCFFYSRCPQ